MLYFLSKLLMKKFASLSFLRLFTYITFRGMLSFIFAFFLVLLLGRRIINKLYRAGIRDEVRQYGLSSSFEKKGTPTMGGIIIMIACLITTLIWCKLDNGFIWLVLLSAYYFGAIGIIDDYLKKKYKSSDKGLSRKYKYLSQIGFGIVFGILVLNNSTSPLPENLQSVLTMPFLKNFFLELSFFYVFVIVFFIVYSANAVNFADGLDGLATVPSLFVIGVYGLFAYIFGNVKLSEHFLYPFIPNSGELAVFSATVVGCLVGFLWFNSYPAEVFMGDSGSLFLGGIIGAMAILIKQEIILFLLGGIFLAEILSVAIQEWIGFKLLGRRIFFRAPIHHTFQYRGIAETKVVIRFWIVSAILAILTLATLKLR